MRSQYCGEVTESIVDQSVELCGWVAKRRDHGGVIFVDLRDKTGVVQVVLQPEQAEMFTEAECLRNEFVIRIKGDVRARPEGMKNENLPTGQIEVIATSLTIFNTSETPPFQLDEYHSVNEDIRLKHRYLDLRRPEMQHNLRFRAKVVQEIRRFLEPEGFLDIETPFLMKATPEGARDYLVPSRTQPGQFFALPQSPQLFKQMLMMSGMDRYYQIVRCFRDEDLRADRQPEFTQLDLEASFVDQEFILNMMENMMRTLFKNCLDVELPDPFLRLTYADAMTRFGSDKPDLRIPFELIDVSDLAKEVDFKVFSGPANDLNGRVAAMCLPGGCELSRKDIDGYTEYVKIFGAKGLAYIKVNDRAQGMEGLQSPILKFFKPEIVEAILERVEAKTGDVVFFGADSTTVVNDALGALRVKLGHERNLLDKPWAPLWVIDFPMFESADGGGVQPLHHPFTAPQNDDPKTLLENPAQALAKAYDMVLNGTELGGGSERIYDQTMQKAVFQALKMDEQEADEKFGFFLDALKYGCPPHAGIAFGLDRIIMIMLGASSIRDVIAFPKTQSAQCILTGAPSPADQAQLKELSIRLRQPITKEGA